MDWGPRSFRRREASCRARALRSLGVGGEILCEGLVATYCLRKVPVVSRIGKQPVQIPSGVKVNASPDGGGTRVRVEGPKGKLDIAIRGEAKVAVEGDNVVVTRAGDTRFERSYHGTARALLANMVHGVSEGFKKSLEIIGVGYQAKLQGKTVVLNIGFCHPVELPRTRGPDDRDPQSHDGSYFGSGQAGRR